jgi:hypothetical protein
MGTTADKLQALLNSKKQLKETFGLAADLPFSQYAANINVTPGTGMSLYKCAEVGPAESGDTEDGGDTGSSTTNTNLIVSGAGTATVNGTYELKEYSYDTSYGVVWTNENNIVLFRDNSYRTWGFFSYYLDYAFYRSNESDLDSPVNCTWQAIDGELPLPVVTLASGGSDSGSTSEMPEPFTWNGYKAVLVEKTTTTEGETVVVVSGAGMADANGTYTLVDINTTGYNRVWSMTNDTGTYTIKWYEDDSWYLDFGDTYPWLYRDTNASENPYNTEWVSVNGNEPAPTVTQQTTEGTSETKKYYTFEETLTTGLTFGMGFTPVVDKVYDAEAMVIAELGLEEQS